MTTRTVTSEYERQMLLKLIHGHKLPFTVDIAKGKRRSVDQNRLQRLWCNEVAEQRGEFTAEEVL